ncbi:MAG TPA: response regulator [Blastocatellia bacterium]|nr:response regulator [Blastocatellia bacterium]
MRGEFYLELLDDGRTFALDAPRLTIGRDRKNSLCLPYPAVSRYHAELTRMDEFFLLRDVGSTNGIYINGALVTEQLLNDGDVVRFGNTGPSMVFKRSDHSKRLTRPEPIAAGTTRNLIEALSGILENPTTDPREETNLRCALAEAYLNKGKPEAALDTLSKYVDTAIPLSLPPQFRARVFYWIGRCRVDSKQYAQAIDALHRSLGLYMQVADEAGIAEAQAALGRALIGLDDLISARDTLHRALLTARRLGNSRLLADVYLLLGRVDWKEGDLEGARHNWSRAIAPAEKTNDTILKARVQLQQAFILYSEGKLKEAASAYQTVINQIESIGNVRFLLKAYSNLSRALMRLGSWSAAERLLEDRLRMARDNKVAKAEAVALTDLAELRLLQGNLAAAHNVIKLALNRHGGTVYARTQRILGRILTAMGQHAESLIELEKGLEAARKKGALEEQILISLKLALVHLETGDVARAREQLESVESSQSLDPALSLMGRALYTRGAIEAASGQMAEANRSFTQSLSIFKTIGDPFRAGLCHAAIGGLREGTGRLESARAHLEEAQQIFAKLGALAELQRVEAQLHAKTLENVRPMMTRTLSHGLTQAAPLSMSISMTAVLDEVITQSIPRRVLVAEADDEVAQMLTRGLEVENYVVDRVQDGRAALERVNDPEWRYDLLVLNALLEHRSGFDLCRELRNRKIETPIILLGTRQGLEDKIEALQAGADEFISKKNLVFEELLAKVEALLR